MHELEKLAAQHCAIILRLFSAQMEARIFLLQLRTKEKRQISNIEQGMMNVELNRPSSREIPCSIFEISLFLTHSTQLSIALPKVDQSGRMRHTLCQ